MFGVCWLFDGIVWGIRCSVVCGVFKNSFGVVGVFDVCSRWLIFFRYC